jgi:nucleoside-diphosphate-sugar epimerase
MRRVLVTGASGFIGTHLVRVLKNEGFVLRLALRQASPVPEDLESIVIGDLASPHALDQACRNIDQIVHCAGIAHATETMPEDVYQRVNVEGTRLLAHAAQKAGVKRFVFLSSVRAQSGPSHPDILSEDDPCQPTDAYGRSKVQAEQLLAALDIDHAILRPVLVYGADVKGHMASLIKLAATPLPLPFGALDARRSLLSQNNLASAVVTVLRQEGPVRRAFLAADDEVLSLGEVLAALRSSRNRAPRLIAVPEGWLTLMLRLVGREEWVSRLCESLVVETKALKSLGWQPRERAPDALAWLGTKRHQRQPDDYPVS